MAELLMTALSCTESRFPRVTATVCVSEKLEAAFVTLMVMAEFTPFTRSV
jgi:hypothetical protein